MTMSDVGDARKINIWNFEIQGTNTLNRFGDGDFSCFERLFGKFHFSSKMPLRMPQMVFWKIYRVNSQFSEQTETADDHEW